MAQISDESWLIRSEKGESLICKTWSELDRHVIVRKFLKRRLLWQMLNFWKKNPINFKFWSL